MIMKQAIATIDRDPLPAAHYSGEKSLVMVAKERIDPRLVCLTSPRSSAADSYQGLRNVVENLRTGDCGIVIGVTSACRGDGKTLTAINLAGALAQNPQASVLLVDLDLRKPNTGIRNYLGLKAQAGPGLVDWIRNPALGCKEITHYQADFNLYVITTGATAASPYELLKSPRLEEFLLQARLRHDFVILDTTQVLHLPDTQLISRKIDGFLFVARADHTASNMIEDSLNLLEQGKLLGLVFNGNSAAR
jgi:Mrp family chromosome partitioning ATPase